MVSRLLPFVSVTVNTVKTIPKMLIHANIHRHPYSDMLTIRSGNVLSIMNANKLTVQVQIVAAILRIYKKNEIKKNSY